jgi:hypothetical protein
MPLRQHLLIVDDQRVDRAIGTQIAADIAAVQIELDKVLSQLGTSGGPTVPEVVVFAMVGGWVFTLILARTRPYRS